MFNSFLHIAEDPAVLPAADNDFIFGGTVPEAWTLTRASTALGRGADGRWASYAANQPRPHHHPVTLANGGMLLEPTRTQLIYSSRPLVITTKNAAVTADTTTQTPFGIGCTRLADNATNGTHGFDLYFGAVNRAAALPDGATVSVQMTFKPFGGLTRGVIFAQVKSGVYRTCDFSIAGTTPSILSHTMLAASITPDTDGFFRLEFTLNYGSGTVTTGSANLSFAQDDGNRFYVGDGTKGFLIAHYGAEIGAECTSPIVSTGASVTRAEDVLSSQGAWLQVGEKSLGIEYTPMGASPQVILNAAGADSIEFWNDGQTANYSLTAGGVNVGSLTGAAPSAGTERTTVLTATFNLFWLAQDGQKLAFDQEGQIPNAIDSIRIGGRVSGGFVGPMLLKRMKHWNEALDREAAAAFSADLGEIGIAPVLPVLDVQASRAVPPEETTLVHVVTLSGEPSGATVSYRTVDGTAKAGIDYTAVTGTITFSPGVSIQTISIPLLTRSLQETRGFSLELFAPVGATLGNAVCVFTLTKSNPVAHAPLKIVQFDGPISADWSAARTTPGYARDNTGIWRSVPAGQARIHFTAADDVGVLLEPGTTQSIFDSVDFGYLTGVTKTMDTTTQTPVGTRTAKIRETATTAAHLFRAFWDATTATWPTGDFTTWMLVKRIGTRDVYRFSVKGKDSIWKQVRFNLATLTVVSAPADCIATIEAEPMAPGWIRIGVARGQAVISNVNAEFDICPVDGANNNVLAGDVNNGLDICHFQVEPGLTVTSPIPVTAQTAVTIRDADVFKAAGTWYKRQSFALGIKFKRLSAVPALQRIVQFRDAAPEVDDYGLLVSSGVVRAALTTANVWHGDIVGPNSTVGQYVTAVVSVDTTRYAMFVGGVKSGEFPMAGKTQVETVEHLRLGSTQQASAGSTPIVVQTIAYWTLGLSDDEGVVFSANLTGTPPGEVEPEPLPLINVPAVLSVPEGQALTVPVTKIGNGACSVNFVTKSQTASFGVDYTGIGSTNPASPNARILTFAENESTKLVTVQTTADTVTDPGETFGYSVSVFNTPADCQLGNAVGVATIVDANAPAVGSYARAHGFATHVDCGENRAWYTVTNLDDSGTGSLRDALSASNRNIIFEVGGTIVLKDHIKGTISNVTVHGETAPSPGIIIQKYELQVRGSNQRYSHLTLERGHDNSDYGVDNGDCLKINPGNGTNNWTRSNIHFDHCLFLWSQDEMIEIWPWNSILSDISFTNCYFGEALWKPQNVSSSFRAHKKVADGTQTQHNYGMIVGFGTKRLDVQHCVYADMDMRFPFIDHSTSVVLANNIAFNCTKGATIQHNSDPKPAEKMLTTCRGYLCISGPQSIAHSGFRFHSYANPMYAGTRVCVSDLYGWKGGSATSTYITPDDAVEYNATRGKPYCVEGGKNVDVEVTTPPIDIPSHPVAALTADEIYARATANCGPLPKIRSNHALRVIDKLKTKAGQWVNHESEVGGRTAYKLVTRKLDGTATFSDGTTITAPPTFSATPTATQITAGKAWINEFRKRVQYDHD